MGKRVELSNVLKKVYNFGLYRKWLVGLRENGIRIRVKKVGKGAGPREVYWRGYTLTNFLFLLVSNFTIPSTRANRV